MKSVWDRFQDNMPTVNPGMTLDEFPNFLIMIFVNGVAGYFGYSQLNLLTLFLLISLVFGTYGFHELCMVS